MKAEKELTILISASSSPCMPGMVAAIRHNGERSIRIVGVDMASDPSARFLVDAFYQVPRADDPEYCDMVLQICRDEEVDIYFPTISAEVEAVADRMDEFSDMGVKVSISSIESIHVSNNKLKTYRVLEQAGIPVPRYYGVHSVEEFIEGCESLGYPDKPVCLKIASGSGSRGVRIIDGSKPRYGIFAHEKPNSYYTSYREMLDVLKGAPSLEEMLLVEVMHGPEFTVDVLCGDGEVLYSVGRRNILSIMSIAQESVIETDPLAERISAEVVKLLHMDGNVGFDFLRNDKEEAVLMDINPRITATVSLAAASGVNLPYLRIKQLLGEKLPVCRPAVGTRVRRRYGEIYTDIDGNLIGSV